jgi:hypothetical protein
MAFAAAFAAEFAVKYSLFPRIGIRLGNDSLPISRHSRQFCLL